MRIGAGTPGIGGRQVGALDQPGVERGRGPRGEEAREVGLVPDLERDHLRKAPQHRRDEGAPIGEVAAARGVGADLAVCGLTDAGTVPAALPRPLGRPVGKRDRPDAGSQHRVVDAGDRRPVEGVDQRAGLAAWRGRLDRPPVDREAVHARPGASGEGDLLLGAEPLRPGGADDLRRPLRGRSGGRDARKLTLPGGSWA